MLIVHADVLVKAAKKHRDAASALAGWRTVVEDAEWHSLADVQQVYPHADGVSLRPGFAVTVFNIRGNNYRLLTTISYRTRIVNVVGFLTHAEYDKNQWKQRL